MTMFLMWDDMGSSLFIGDANNMTSSQERGKRVCSDFPTRESNTVNQVRENFMF